MKTIASITTGTGRGFAYPDGIAETSQSQDVELRIGKRRYRIQGWDEDRDAFVIEAIGVVQHPQPEQLRAVADWLDIYDRLAQAHFDLLEKLGLSEPEELARVRAVAAGKEVQGDLRDWAREIER